MNNSFIIWHVESDPVTAALTEDFTGELRRENKNSSHFQGKGSCPHGVVLGGRCMIDAALLLLLLLLLVFCLKTFFSLSEQQTGNLDISYTSRYTESFSSISWVFRLNTKPSVVPKFKVYLLAS